MSDDAGPTTRRSPGEIEISEEMLKAGEAVLEDSLAYFGERALALMVYRAMIQAKCRTQKT